MISDRTHTRVPMRLPKVQASLKWEQETVTSTPRHRISSFNRQQSERFSKGIFISQYESLVRQKSFKDPAIRQLKNVNYVYKYFGQRLPSKDFKSSHLVCEELYEKQPELVQQRKWEINSHINKIDKVYSWNVLKRIEKQEDQIHNKFETDVAFIKKQNQQNVDSEKIRRYEQYKIATQFLLDKIKNELNYEQILQQS
ncbi:hypothetical protein pb186bvf_004254 [Paramecium bursaria]